MSVATEPKTSWAELVDETEQPETEQRQETVAANGIRTIVEYITNDDGKKVKVTRRIRRVEKRTLVNHEVAERKNWSKFGAEKGKKPGPDNATTTVGENVTLKLVAGNKAAEQDKHEEQAKTAQAKKVSCRLCKGDHFTSKCPYRQELELVGIRSDAPPSDDLPPADAPAAASGTGKYVPPGMRLGGRTGESMNRPREDLPTLRVTNVSEDATEEDLRDLFHKFGPIHRVYIGRDRETGIGKGYAFVSFQEKAVAEKAMQKINGLGYDNLILNCQWSQPREPRNAT